MVNKKLLVIAVVLLLGILGWVFYPHSQKNIPKSTTTPSQSSNSKPPDEAIKVVQQYIQARENSIGADRSSPTAWLASVQAISTSEWFAELQPDPNSPTATTPAEYYTAHDSGFRVTAKVTNCIWDRESKRVTATSGDVYCDLNDTTLDRSGKPVSGTALPFGWSHSGPQTPILLELVKQGGVWLINEDGTGQG